MKLTLANFVKKSITFTKLFPLFWKTVGILEDQCKLKVMTVTTDGASSHQTIYQMHKDMKHSAVTNHEERNIVYKTDLLKMTIILFHLWPATFG